MPVRWKYARASTAMRIGLRDFRQPDERAGRKHRQRQFRVAQLRLRHFGARPDGLEPGCQLLVVERQVLAVRAVERDELRRLERTREVDDVLIEVCGAGRDV